MKRYLKPLLIALLIPLIGMGQKTLTSKDTLTLPVDLSGTLAATSGTTITFPSPYDKPKPDTVKVLILVCDTSTSIAKQVNLDSMGYMSLHDAQVYSYSVYWQFGYEVKTEYPLIDMGYRYGTGRTVICYLNQDKSPMRKSVVVWMVREIE